MKHTKDYFLRMYSFSALLAYAAAMFLLAVVSFFDESLNIERIAAAVGTGGFFIVLGELLASQYHASMKLYGMYKETVSLYKIIKNTVVLDKHYFDGKDAHSWLSENITASESEMNKYKSNAESEKFLPYIGVAMTTLGFSSILLVFASDSFYARVSPIQAMTTIISFSVLAIAMIFKEYNDRQSAEIGRGKDTVFLYIDRLAVSENRNTKREVIDSEGKGDDLN